MDIPVSHDSASIQLELHEGIAHPSILSTTLLFAVKEEDIASKTIFDVGCGSGYLGLGLLARGAQFLYGSDISPAAVSHAKSMAVLNGLEEKACFRQGNYLEPFADISSQIGFVISNPPQTSKALLSKDYPKKQAVDGGRLGDEAIIAVLKSAAQWLVPEGIIYVSISSLSNPKTILKEANLGFNQVEVVAEHGIPFDIWRLEKWEVLRHHQEEGSAEIFLRDGFPFWKVRIMRCQFPKKTR